MTPGGRSEPGSPVPVFPGGAPSACPRRSRAIALMVRTSCWTQAATSVTPTTGSHQPKSDRIHTTRSRSLPNPLRSRRATTHNPNPDWRHGQWRRAGSRCPDPVHSLRPWCLGSRRERGRPTRCSRNPRACPPISPPPIPSCASRQAPPSSVRLRHTRGRESFGMKSLDFGALEVTTELEGDRHRERLSPLLPRPVPAWSGNGDRRRR